MTAGFRARLAERQVQAQTVLCVGLDPKVEKIPQRFKDDFHLERHPERVTQAVLAWMKKTVDITHPYASLYKPNAAFWEVLPGGYEALGDLTDHIHELYELLALLDCKRGDIGNTQAMYGDAVLRRLGFDGMNFCPYMGRDTMSALARSDRPDKALVGLAYTSNPDAREMQNPLLHGGQPYWEYTAECIFGWAQELGVVEDAGLVMAAAHKNPTLKNSDGPETVYSGHLTRAREITGDLLWYLVPGVGTQGGFAEETIRAGYRGPGSLAVNSSSGIIFADDPAEEARKLRDQLNDAIATLEAERG